MNINSGIGNTINEATTAKSRFRNVNHFSVSNFVRCGGKTFDVEVEVIDEAPFKYMANLNQLVLHEEEMNERVAKVRCYCYCYLCLMVIRLFRLW